MTGLHGRTALVTGGSRGIGAATAKLLAAHGAAVAVNGRDADAVAAMTAEIAEEGGRAMAAVGDVTRFEQVEAVRESGGSAPFGLVTSIPGEWVTTGSTLS
jgi:3-oxoacyl-[acyl-carrier protein] reductase